MYVPEKRDQTKFSVKMLSVKKDYFIIDIDTLTKCS